MMKAPSGDLCTVVHVRLKLALGWICQLCLKHWRSPSLYFWLPGFQSNGSFSLAVPGTKGDPCDPAQVTATSTSQLLPPSHGSVWIFSLFTSIFHSCTLDSLENHSAPGYLSCPGTARDTTGPNVQRDEFCGVFRGDPGRFTFVEVGTKESVFFIQVFFHDFHDFVASRDVTKDDEFQECSATIGCFWSVFPTGRGRARCMPACHKLEVPRCWLTLDAAHTDSARATPGPLKPGERRADSR